MAINIWHEQLVPLGRAAKYFPRSARGKKLHRTTLYRYTTTGREGVVLESVQAGFVRCTSVEAIARFFEALTKAKGLRSPSSSHAVTEADAAGKRLAATVFAKHRRRMRKEDASE